MTVLYSVQGAVKPGRAEEFLSQSGEAHKLFDRLGANAVRVSVPVAGAPPDGFVFSAEYDTSEEWGAFQDHLNTDAEFQGFVTRISSPDAPTTITSISTSVEIPLRQGNRTRGSVAEIHVSRPTTGAMERVLAEATRVCELVEARGATNARLFQIGYAGAGGGLLLLSWEFENLTALGRVGDLWMSDPEMIEVAATRFAVVASNTQVFDAIYQVVPI